jgi:hypothetical protein
MRYVFHIITTYIREPQEFFNIVINSPNLTSDELLLHVFNEIPRDLLKQLVKISAAQRTPNKLAGFYKERQNDPGFYFNTDVNMDSDTNHNRDLLLTYLTR